MQLSRFNVVKTEGETTWVYNTRSTAFVKIDTHTWNTVLTAPDPEVQTILQAEGILTDDVEAEWLTYKYQYYSNALRSRRLFVSIAPTMRCNFACAYCFEGTNKVFPTMNEEVEAALVKFLILNSKNGVTINWFGGEPLLAWERILSICRQLEERNVEFRSSIVTNGSLLTPDKLPQFTAIHPTFIQISMDGVGPTHDARRSFKNGKPSFDIIMGNIDHLLSETDIPLVIQVAVDHTNETAFDELLEELNHRYPEFVKTRRIQIGCNHVQDRTRFDKNKICYTHADLFHEQMASLHTRENNARTPRLPGMSLPCMYRSANTYAIDSAGYIYRCIEHLGDPTRHVGSLKEGKISLTALAQTTFAEDPFEDEACRRCNVLPICGGGCPLDRIAAKRGEGGSPCSYYKKYLPELLPALYERHYVKRKKKEAL